MIFFQGLLLGFAYVAPIGIQNLYVINTALRTNLTNVIIVALITIFFDISLALTCFLGIGVLIDKHAFIKQLFILLGSIAVIIIGFKLISAKISLAKKTSINDSFMSTMLACFMITWFNPQAIIDGSLLLGGYRAALTPENSKLFILGVVSASSLWFLSLAIITSIFHKIFSPKILRIINIICGIVIIFYGIKLGLSLFF